MKSYALTTLVSAVAAIGADQLEFVNYTARFNKAYEEMKEYAVRQERFLHYNKLISEHNATKTNFVLGHNRFSDWTDEEYEAILGYVPSGTSENHQ